jgi:hypothetical protein
MQAGEFRAPMAVASRIHARVPAAAARPTSRELPGRPPSAPLLGGFTPCVVSLRSSYVRSGQRGGASVAGVVAAHIGLQRAHFGALPAPRVPGAHRLARLVTPLPRCPS